MRWRRWVVCSVIVLAAHGALFEALQGHGALMHQGETRSARSPPVVRLVLLSPDQAAVAAASQPPVAASAPATDDKPALRSTPPAPQASIGQASGATRDAETPPPVTTVIYRSPADLDQPIRPRSAPDLSMLKGLAWSGVPIRLRLFIDSRGTVVDTQVLESADPDEVLARVRAMFLATGFTTGLVGGQPVPSYKDIEITVGNPP